jgi:hypothetical protein
MSAVCVLAPDQAEAFEQRGVVPNCKYHRHVSHKKADALVAVVFDRARMQFFEGEGEARTVEAPSYLFDGKRRITLIPRILCYAGKSSYTPYGRGMSTMQAIMEKVK